MSYAILIVPFGPLFDAPECVSSGRSAAWLARLVRDQEAGGSNPLAPTISPVPLVIPTLIGHRGFLGTAWTTFGGGALSFEKGLTFEEVHSSWLSNVHGTLTAADQFAYRYSLD